MCPYPKFPGSSFQALCMNIQHSRVLLRTEILEGNAIRSELSAIVFKSQVGATARPDWQAEWLRCLLGRDWYLAAARFPWNLREIEIERWKGTLKDACPKCRGSRFKYSLAWTVNIRHSRVFRTEISECNANRLKQSTIVFASPIDGTAWVVSTTSLSPVHLTKQMAALRKPREVLGYDLITWNRTLGVDFWYGI